MIRLIKKVLPVIDFVLVPFVFLAAWLMKLIRRAGMHRLPLVRSILLHVGVLPIRNHYFEPQFDYRDYGAQLTQERTLPGIDWNEAGQLQFLQRLGFAEELSGIPQQAGAELEFHFNNGSYESGDAEYWYQLIRALRPARIIEVGSGNSTLMARKAIEANLNDQPSYSCEHICIEPYEMPWLEQAGVQLLRQKVEQLDIAYFSRLQRDDILFIDSTHIIRPEGDVLHEYLQLLPSLNSGVIVHIHDIFSPWHYPSKWLQEQVLFWNEQYLLEAFLSHNSDWEIIGALNFLKHKHFEELLKVTPYLTPDRVPGSIYLRKLN